LADVGAIVIGLVDVGVTVVGLADVGITVIGLAVGVTVVGDLVGNAVGLADVGVTVTGLAVGIEVVGDLVGSAVGAVHEASHFDCTSQHLDLLAKRVNHSLAGPAHGPPISCKQSATQVPSQATYHLGGGVVGCLVGFGIDAMQGPF
jgi:hypothetical protein